MILIEKTLGNIKDRNWEGAEVEQLVLEQWEAPKSRLRKRTESGLELAISLPRSEHLHDGDVLYHDPVARRIVVATIAMREVMVIEMEDFKGMSAAEILSIGFELGHGLGNQHWPAVIKGTTIYVPVSVDRKVMSSVMRTHAFRHATMHFEPGEVVAERLDPSEARLLFAGADASPHKHYDQEANGHDQDHGHDHDHHHDHNHHHGHRHDHGVLL
ncbi:MULTISPECIES: urease accessory protein UreE [unclassified Devosia]|uniref:urease accessory protein UreE n=1 Tax=unclassified Devosia TaxID=196773 RepID=UPI00155495C4|nr:MULTISPECIES: urease accessory protein UreE [unclassified Devosia]